MPITYTVTRTPRPAGEPTLPKSVQAYLDAGAAEGGRNRALFAAAAQLRDIGATEAVASDTLTARALADGLPADEVATTIRHVFAVPPRQPPTGSNGAPAPTIAPTAARRTAPAASTPRHGSTAEKPASIAEARAVELPEAVEDGFRKLLMAAFREGEGVCVAPTRSHEDGTRTPETGVTLTREQWLEKIGQRGGIAKMFPTKHGLFMRVNPLTPQSNGRNEDVTAFRHVLVEFDKDGEGKNIPKELQLGAILHSGLPITAILDSGNKSVHAWVRVDAESKEQYEERVEKVYALFDSAALDSANRNPARLSRCPEGLRTVGRETVTQNLLALNVGAGTWAKWERSRSTTALGPAIRPSYLRNYDVKNDPNNVLGTRWLCLGGSVIFVSQSGVGKSSLNMQLAMGWALQRDDMTFGIKAAKPLKSLILQAENDDGDVAEAYQGVAAAFNLTDAEHDKLDEMLVWHRVTTLTGPEFCRATEDAIALYGPDMCWIDPLINFIGADLSDAEVIAHFCTGYLNAISRDTGVIWAIVHHTGKPPKEGFNGTASDEAYAGLGSSALTNWAREVVNLRRVKAPEGDPPTFKMTACKRRKRAGMKDMNHEDAESIFIRHSPVPNRIAWEQCEEPAAPEKKGRGKAGAEGGGTTYTIKRKGAGGAENGIPGVVDVEGGEALAEGASPARTYTLARKTAGAPSKLTRAAQAIIMQTRVASGGHLAPAQVQELAKAHGVSPRTIIRFIQSASGEGLEVPHDENSAT